jgi:acyl-CoA thioesterase
VDKQSNGENAIGHAFVTSLDTSLLLESVAPGLWRGLADPQYEAGNGMFGGWTAALMLNAVLNDPAAEGSASAVNVNFLDRVPATGALVLRTERLSTSRSLSHWRCDVLQEGSEKVSATSTIVLANRRESDHHTEAKMPVAPPPETFSRVEPPPRFGEKMDMRLAFGAVMHNQTTTRSIAWEREMSGRPIDALQIAMLSDLGLPRVFYVSAGPRPSVTITLSTYFHATTAELSACGDDYILAEMIGTRIEHSTVGSKTNLWSRAGTLLATTEQLCWFR